MGLGRKWKILPLFYIFLLYLNDMTLGDLLVFLQPLQCSWAGSFSSTWPLSFLTALLLFPHFTLLSLWESSSMPIGHSCGCDLHSQSQLSSLLELWTHRSKCLPDTQSWFHLLPQTSRTQKLSLSSASLLPSIPPNSTCRLDLLNPFGNSPLLPISATTTLHQAAMSSLDPTVVS